MTWWVEQPGIVTVALRRIGDILRFHPSMNPRLKVDPKRSHKLIAD
jgi:hypothetical protein